LPLSYTGRHPFLPHLLQTLTLIRQVDPKLTAEVCGSYRRGAATSGDMDVLMTHPEYISESQDGSPQKKKVRHYFFSPPVTGLKTNSVAARLRLTRCLHSNNLRLASQSCCERLWIISSPMALSLTSSAAAPARYTLIVLAYHVACNALE